MTNERAILEAQLARRVAELRAKAAKLQAESDRIHATVNDDYAFWTQPAYGNAAGRAFARSRDRERARLGKSIEIAAEARAIAAKADEMEARGVVMAGDAAAAHKAKIAACAVKVGDMVSSVYGINRVAKVNRVTVALEGRFGPVTIGKELIQLVRAA